MTSLIDRLLGLHGVIVYVIVGGLVFVEDALFVGFVIPGETAAVLGGVAASRHQVSLAAMMIIVVLAAIIGDTVGYEVGRHLGPRMLDSRPLRHRTGKLRSAQDFLARKGGSAVFLGRFVAFFRAVMPALAGSSRMPYPRFLAYNAAGGLTWGVGFVLLGYLAGNSYAAVERLVGRGVAIAVAVIVIALLVTWRIRKARRERRAGGGQLPETPQEAERSGH